MQLDVLDVNKSYGKESILHHIEFSVGSGEIVGLVGESGCGKSTLARLLCCYEKLEKILLDLEKKNGSSSGAVYR